MTRNIEKEAANKAAKEYADKTIFVSELGEEADAEVMIRNLRFMAYHSGYTNGAAHARQAVRIDKDRPKLGDQIILWYKLPSGRLSWCAGEVDGDDDGLFVDCEVDGVAIADGYAWMRIPNLPTLPTEGDK